MSASHSNPQGGEFSLPRAIVPVVSHSQAALAVPADTGIPMPENPFAKLVIRTGAVRDPELGFLLAADPKKEQKEILHTNFFKWKAGVFQPGTLNFSAHTCCDVQKPQPAIVMVASQGEFCAASPTATHFGNIFEQSSPEPSDERYGSFRSVAEVAGKAYAVGLRGMVYRLDEWVHWTRLDDGLPRTFEIQAIHGFADSDLYAVGRRGEMWQMTRNTWVKRELPTNVILSAVKCAGDETVYVAGQKGVLIRGRQNAWTVVEHEETTADIWDLEWFAGALYVSTMAGVFTLTKDRLDRVDFGKDVPKTTYQLSAGKGVLWSIGNNDVMAFDGKKWTRIV